jgi:hypothetical protein
MSARWLTVILMIGPESVCVAASTVIHVALPTNDIVYDPVSDRILASVPSSAGAQHGNSITPINPYTGELGTSVFVASEPTKLALADDGSRVYVASAATNYVTPFSLLTMSPGTSFPIANVSLRVDEMDVAPGNADVLAVSLRGTRGSPRGNGVALFLNGKLLPKTTDEINNVIEFGATASTLYGYNSELSSRDLNSYSIDLSPTGGIAARVYHVENLLVQDRQDMEFDNGRLYFTNGHVIEANTPTSLGFLSANGPVEPDSSTSRTYLVTGNKLMALSQTSLLPLGEMTIPEFIGLAKNLISLGSTGFALATTTDKVFIIPRIPGDFDANGMVDVADFILWEAGYGSTTTLIADANRDKVVDAADCVIWRDNLGVTLFGSQGAGLSSQPPVPEPATGILLFVAVVSLPAKFVSPRCICRLAP